MELFIYMILIAIAGASETIVRSMKQVKSLYVTILTRSVTFENSGTLVCARECMRRNEWCFSFSYNKDTKQCNLGDWIVPYDTARDGNELLYTTGAFCDTSFRLNFVVHWSEGISACMCWSTSTLNYTNARSACQDKGAHLYTLKRMEKFQIFIENVIVPSKNVYWVGLDDIKVEGTFVWVDDGSILDDTLLPQLFSPGTPNDFNGNEDCVCYSFYFPPFNDCNCVETYRYVCERSSEGYWV